MFSFGLILNRVLNPIPLHRHATPLYTISIIPTDEAEKVTSELRGTRTLGTTPAQQEKERPLQRAPVWCRQSTLRRSSLNLLLLQNAREG